MKTKLKLFAICQLLTAFCLSAHAQGTAFTYQGRLNTGGVPANGSYDVAFTLYATNLTGNAIAGPVTNSAVAVTNGLFTTLVDFGNAFTGTSNWLELAVSTNGANSSTTLTPRQQLTPAPYALFASGANAAGLSGTIPAAQLPGSVVTNGAGGLTLNGVFGGDGSGVTNVPGSWSVNGTNLYYNTGNVGIGTNNPPGTLYVLGSAPSSLVGPVTGVQTSGVPSSAAVVGVCLLPGGNGLVGESDVLQPGWSGPHQANIGVKGVSATTNGTGVFGYEAAPNGVTYGVIGETASPQGYAGYFVGNSYFSGNVGIGTNNPPTALFVAANGTSYGTISGIQTGGSTYCGGVLGRTLVAGGNGVLGESDVVATNISGAGNGSVGVYGSSIATNGTGVTGLAVASTGFTYGVFGQVNSPQGYAGYFQGNGYFSGFLGVGTANPVSALQVNGTVTATAFTGNGNGLTNIHGAWSVNGGNLFYTNGLVAIGTNNPSAPLHVFNSGYVAVLADSSSTAGTWSVLRNTSTGGTNWHIISTGSANGEGPGKLLFDHGSTPSSITGNALTLQANGNVGIDNTSPGNLLVVGSSGSPAYCNGTTWVNGSDRNSKEDFAVIDPRTVLDKVSALPITEWRYKVEADGARHIGPMAQDFHAAFGLNGPDDKHISTVDEGGVALAAIQGLNEKVETRIQEQEARSQNAEASIQKLAAENADLKKELSEIKALLAKITTNRN